MYIGYTVQVPVFSTRSSFTKYAVCVASFDWSNMKFPKL
ncbi:hypothetical protein [uncultured Methanobrevibacter sp.]